MLLIIDLHGTDITALYSLLSSCKSNVKNWTFQWRVKLLTSSCTSRLMKLYLGQNECTCSSWRLSSTNEFFRLNLKGHGRFRIEKRFRNRIFSCHSESHVYWKAYSRAVRGHILCASAVPSRTSPFWLNYVKHVYLIPEFIRVERVHDWNLHVLVIKSMLNFFAATGHNNYGKSCRLYLQSILELETNHPKVYDQFIEGQHTVRTTENKWTGIWTDLSVEQILMKSLERRAGVIGKGITENVMHVWTKTMPCTEVQPLQKPWISLY